MTLCPRRRHAIFLTTRKNSQKAKQKPRRDTMGQKLDQFRVPNSIGIIHPTARPDNNEPFKDRVQSVVFVELGGSTCLLLTQIE